MESILGLEHPISAKETLGPEYPIPLQPIIRPGHPPGFGGPGAGPPGACEASPAPAAASAAPPQVAGSLGAQVRRPVPEIQEKKEALDGLSRKLDEGFVEMAIGLTGHLHGVLAQTTSLSKSAMPPLTAASCKTADGRLEPIGNSLQKLLIWEQHLMDDVKVPYRARGLGGRSCGERGNGPGPCRGPVERRGWVMRQLHALPWRPIEATFCMEGCFSSLVSCWGCAWHLQRACHWDRLVYHCKPVASRLLSGGLPCVPWQKLETLRHKKHKGEKKLYQHSTKVDRDPTKDLKKVSHTEGTTCLHFRRRPGGSVF